MVSVAEDSEAGVTTVQVLLEKLPTLGLAVPSLKPAGKASATDTFSASDGPLLCTVMVYFFVTRSPAVTDVPSFPTRRSSDLLVLTVSVSPAVLLLALGSLVLLLTVAVLVWLTVVEAGTV